MRFLKEEYLIEGIEDVKRYYPTISDIDFNRIIQLDPTTNIEKDKIGTYSKWLLNLFKQNKLDNEGHVADLLNRFESEKNNLINKDIMQYKSLEDVENMLNDDNSYKTKSARQELRQTQKAVRTTNIEDDAELVYEDNDWVIYIPKTYEASCKLGQGTHWCTATTSDNYYYKQYSKQGPLYIIINKHNPTEKYQFHFESEQFMDKEDDSIFLSKFLVGNPNLYRFFESKLSNAQKNNIKEVKEFLQELEENNGVYIYKGGRIPERARPLVKNIKIANNVTEIDRSAFDGCSSLTSITIPSSVTSIGDYAFQYCTSLTSITIPSSVISIGHSAFDGCSSLTSIKYLGTKSQWIEIELSRNWGMNSSIDTIHCTDGDIEI